MGMGVLALGYIFLFVCVLLLGRFFWGAWLMGSVGVFFLCLWVMREIGRFVRILRYPFAFWLFILGEVMIFGTLFFTLFWMEEVGSVVISEWFELPFLGCFFLIGSSVTATTYHYSYGLPVSRLYLLMTFVLGVLFIFLQGKEFFDCACDLLRRSFAATRFCTVGLHFIHVLLGLLGFIFVSFFDTKMLDKMYVDYVVWY